MTDPDQNNTPQDAGGLSTGSRLGQLGMAAVIIVAIVGATWFLGERNGWNEIGSGGVNQQLLPRVGQVAPELFTLREDGEPTLLSSFRGQPVWINFWGSWCEPCRAEMPEISDAYDTLAPQGVVVLSISMREEPEHAINYRNSAGAEFPVFIDPEKIAAFINADDNPELAARLNAMRSDWQIANFPTHVFIDPEGIVRHVIIAQMTYDEAIEYAGNIMGTPATPQAVTPSRVKRAA